MSVKTAINNVLCEGESLDLMAMSPTQVKSIFNEKFNEYFDTGLLGVKQFKVKKANKMLQIDIDNSMGNNNLPIGFDLEVFVLDNANFTVHLYFTSNNSRLESNEFSNFDDVFKHVFFRFATQAKVEKIKMDEYYSRELEKFQKVMKDYRTRTKQYDKLISHG